MKKQAPLLFNLIKAFLFIVFIASPATIQAQVQTPQYSVNTKHPSTLAGKPIGFYLNHPAIPEDARRYYEGKFNPGDNAQTHALLDSTLTKNAEIRPFYFFVANQLMKSKDSPLTEYLASICTRYFGQHPCEFTRWLKDGGFDIDTRHWATLIAFNLYTREAFKKYADALPSKNCETQTLKTFMDDVQRIVTEINVH